MFGELPQLTEMKADVKMNWQMKRSRRHSIVAIVILASVTTCAVVWLVSRATVLFVPAPYKEWSAW